MEKYLKLSHRYFLCRIKLYFHVKANTLNYLTTILVFRYLILPFSFEASTHND